MRRTLSGLLCAWALWLLAGCGGGGARPASGLGFVDSDGRALSGTVPRGRLVLLGLTGQPPRCQIEVLVTGPGATQTAPTGELVVAYTQIGTDGNGVLPRCVVVPELPDGTYSVFVRRLIEDDPPVVIGTQSLTIGPVAGVLSLQTGLLSGATFTPARVFNPGESVAVQASGLPANAQADLYVLPYDGPLLVGRTLVDVSGYHAGAPTPEGQRVTRVLRGPAEAVQADASGKLAPLVVWPDVHTEALKKGFTVVLDRNRNGFYEPNIDLCSEQSSAAFIVHTVTRATGDIEVQLSSDGQGNKKTLFTRDQHVWVSNDPSVVVPAGTYDFPYFVVKNKDSWADGDALADVSHVSLSYGSYLSCAPPSLLAGTYPRYYSDLKPGDYDIIVDVDQNKKYTQGVDYIQGLHGPGFTVQEPVIARQKWTVMVYLNGDNNLDEYTIKDLEEMELVPASSEVAIVAQLDRKKFATWSEARRYILQPNANFGFNTEPYERLGEVNMGDPQTLSNFMTWAKTVRPADHYALIIWDHGNGFRTRAVGKKLAFKNISWDDTDQHQSLTLDQIRTVLQQQGGVDLLGFDACLMGMAEVVDEFETVVNVVVGSQMTEPGDSYDFTFLKDLVANPGMSPTEVGNTIVSYWAAFYNARSATTQASFEVSRLAALREAVDQFSRKMLEDPDGDGPKKPGLERPDVNKAVRSAIEATASMEQDDPSLKATYLAHKDMVDLFTQLKAKLPDSELAAACDPVITAARALITSKYINPALRGHNGLAFWAPNETDYPVLKDDYAALRWARQTHWDEFLDKLYNTKVLYRVEFTSTHATWNLSPMLNDDWDPTSNGGNGQSLTLTGYIPNFAEEEKKAVKTITITAEAEDKAYTLWGSYLEIPSPGFQESDMTVKLYKGDESTPIRTLTNHLRCRSGTAYDHWKVLTLNPKTGTIVIHDEIVGIGF